MGAYSITSLALDKDWKLATDVIDPGGANLRTVCRAHNARVVSQLARVVIYSTQGDIPFAPRYGIPWELYIGEANPPIQLLGTFINAALVKIQGISSVDLSETVFDPVTGRIGPICFTIDCDNTQGPYQSCI